MATTEQVIIEFTADTTQLQPGVDKLQEMGDIDETTALIFKKTNDQIKEKNALIAAGLKNTTALTASVDKEQQAYNKLVASVKTLSGASKDAANQILKFTAGDLTTRLKEQNLTIDQLIANLQETGDGLQGVQTDFKETEQASQSLKLELRQISAALAQLLLDGKENTSEFQDLAARAGVLKNAMKDASGVVSDLGEDVPILKTVGAAAQGITAGLSGVSGAFALLGDEGKDMQEVLVRVNALMAIQASVSQLVALANDQQFISTAKLAVAQLTNNAQTAISNGLESQSVIVRGAATVAQYALNAAMKANPIGIVVVALSAFIAALELFTSRAQRAAEAQAKINAAIAAAGEGFDAQVEGLKTANEKYLNELDVRNAKESEKQRAQASGLVLIIKAREQQIQEAESALQTALLSHDKETLAKAAELNTKIIDLKKQNYQDQAKLDEANVKGRDQLVIEQLQAEKDLADGRVAIAVKGSKDLFAAQRTAANAQAAIDLKSAGDNEEKKQEIVLQLHRQLIDIQAAEDAEAENRRQSQIQANLQKTQIESRRINQEITDEETAFQIKAIQDRSKYEQSLEGVSVQRKLEIQTKAQLDIEQLQRDQAERNIKLVNENQNALNKAAIDGIKTTDADRLALEIQTVENEQAIALAGQNLTEQKRQQIIADSEVKIRELKIAAIDKTAQETIARNEVLNAAEVRGLERVLDAQTKIKNATGGLGADTRVSDQLGIAKLNQTEEFALIDELTKKQLAANQVLIVANKKKFDDLLIPEKEYTDTANALVDQNAQIFEAGEQKKRDSVNATAELQKQRNKEVRDLLFQAVNDGIGIVSQLYAQQDAADQARLDKKKQQVQDELDAGIITQKAAEVRNKELDAEQKRLQREQAQRNKEIAIFQAVINTALAVTNAITTGDPYTAALRAAIAGAIGAAQIAVIASQPLPQFYKGKNNEQINRNDYEGWGEIGERGPELWKSGSQMKLAEKSSIVWLKKNDTVYNPAQTEMIMNTKIPVAAQRSNQLVFDYDKLAAAVAKQGKLTLSIDGYAEFIKEQESLTTKLAGRTLSGK